MFQADNLVVVLYFLLLYVVANYSALLWEVNFMDLYSV